MKENTYVVIQSFMLTELGLKGNELIIYAVIYGYTQDGQHWYYGTRSHLAEWCGATKGTVTNCLNSLLGKGLIAKREVQRPGHIEVQYQAVFSTPLPKIGTPPTKNCNTPLPKIDPINNIRDTKDIEGEPPTVEIVENYLTELGASKEYASKFHAHYSSLGWKTAGGAAIKDWKAKAREWLAKDGIKPRREFPPTIACRKCGGQMVKTGMRKSGTDIPYYRCGCGEEAMP